MPPPLLATVYVRPARTFRIPTTPGRDIVVYAGEGKIYNERDMPYVLQRDDVTVEVPAKQMDWLPDWLNACGEHNPPKAKLGLPDGYKLGIRTGEGFYLKERPPFLNEEGFPAEGPFEETDKPTGWMFPTE